MSNRILGHSMGGVPVAWGINTIALAGGRIFYVDPVAGADGNSGRDPDAAFLTIQAAHDATTTAKNDIIVLVAAASVNALAATLAWDHTYTHMVGACAPAGIGQRARVSGSAALDITPLVTITGRGCFFGNIQFVNDKDADTASGCVNMTNGSGNCYFQNCTFKLSNATLLARTDTYSLRLYDASEITFDNCTFGTSDVEADGAGYDVIIEGGAKRTQFKNCRFLTRAHSSTSRVFVKFDNTAVGGTECTIFDNCLFMNLSMNHAVTMTDALSVGGGSSHNVIIKGDSQIVGVTGWADTTTFVYVPNYTTTAAGCSQTPAA